MYYSRYIPYKKGFVKGNVCISVVPVYAQNYLFKEYAQHLKYAILFVEIWLSCAVFAQLHNTEFMPTMLVTFLSKIKQRIWSFWDLFTVKNVIAVSLWSVVFVFVLGLAGTIYPNHLLAAEDAPTQLGLIGNGIRIFASVLAWGASMLAGLCITMAIFFLRFFIQLAAYNGFLDAPVVIVGWRLIRDLANMFFVVILLVIAFATILGQESYEWKKTMVKLVLSAIFINFSLLICGVVIDAAHVFTVTFLNAIAPVAGGNLINMFSLDKVRSIVATAERAQSGTVVTGLEADLFLGALVGLFMAALAMTAIGVYCIILLGRMVYLWVLLILSPLAFIFMVLPATQAQAREWISEFTKYVVAAPLMVFFLWLSFATFGAAGSAADELNRGSVDIPGVEGFESDAALASSGGQTVSINAAATWHGLASFLVGMAFMYAGIDRVQKLGVAGGSLLANAKSFAGKVATVASGYMVGRWLYDRGSQLGGSALKTAYDFAPVVGGRANRNRWENLKQAGYGYLTGKGMAISEGGLAMQEEAKKKQAALEQASGQRDIDSEIEKSREQIEAVQQSDKSDDEKKEIIAKIESDIKEKEAIKNEALSIVNDEDRAAKVKEIEELEQRAQGEAQGGLIGWAVRTDLAYEKQLAKTTKQADNRRQILWKRTGSQAGGKAGDITWMFGSKFEREKDGSFKRDSRGKRIKKEGEERVYLTSFGMGTNGILNTGFLADPIKHKEKEAHDRIEEGWLQAESLRSKAKDYHFQTLGRKNVLQEARVKFNPETGRLGYELNKGSMAYRIEDREMKGDGFEAEINLLKVRAKKRLLDESQEVVNKVNNQEDVKKVKEEVKEFGKTIAGLGNKLTALRALKSNSDQMEAFNQALDERANAILVERGVADPTTASTQQRADARETALNEEGRRNHYEKLELSLKKSQEQAREKAEVEFGDGEIDEFGHATADAIADRLKQFEEQKSAVVKERAEKQKEYATLFREKLEDGDVKAPAWRRSRIRAQQEFEERFYAGFKQRMSDDAAQTHIWDKKGIVTPNSAFDKVTDSFLGDFKEMGYEATVAALEAHNASVAKKRANGETIGFEDKAIAMALLKHMEIGKWIDDGIMPFKKVAEQMRASFGDADEELIGGLNQFEVRLKSKAEQGAGNGGGGSSRTGSGLDAARTRAAVGELLKDLLGDGAKDAVESLRSGGGASRQSFDQALQSARSNLGSIPRSTLRRAGIDADDQAAIDELIEIVRQYADDREQLSLLLDSLS